jgi:hypothetical protein
MANANAQAIVARNGRAMSQHKNKPMPVNNRKPVSRTCRSVYDPAVCSGGVDREFAIARFYSGPFFLKR